MTMNMDRKLKDYEKQNFNLEREIDKQKSKIHPGQSRIDQRV